MKKNFNKENGSTAKNSTCEQKKENEAQNLEMKVVNKKMEKTNIACAKAQGAEASVKKVNYKGTTKDVFEVGCQYENGHKFEVIAREGDKLTIKHLTSNYYHQAGDIENRVIRLAGGEDTNFTEYVKWNYGWECSALNKVQGAESSEKKEIEKCLMCNAAMHRLLMANESDYDGHQIFITKAYEILEHCEEDFFGKHLVGKLLEKLKEGDVSFNDINDAVICLNTEVGETLALIYKKYE